MGGEGKGEGGGFSVTVAAEDEGMTARGVLRRARGVSQRLFRTIAHGEDAAGGGLFINGRPARFRDTVRAGDDIRLVFPEESSHIEPQDIPLSVLYEDDDVLVADKQPGLVVHPTKGHKDGTLANAILWHMRERGENYKPRFISRLDMDTSGVLLVGKNSHAQDSLAKQHAAGGFEKYYTAVLCGRLEDDLPHAGTIDLPIGLAQPGEPRRAVKPAADGGYPS
ncbi:MAG: RluA family pseudouridine synthase, partial [Clostridiales Family XIII bacterium]|nr:RluA family pseudouridine synthase [Clostridiales Family XIII bacterium]